MAAEAEFRTDATNFLKDLNQIGIAGEKDPSLVDWSEAFRLVHSLKSEASFLDQKEVVGLCHGLEEAILPIKENRTIADRAFLDSYFHIIDKVKALVFYQEGQGENDFFSIYEKRLLKEAIQRDEAFYRLKVRIDPEEQMPYARAFLVVSNLEQSVQVVRTEPDLKRQRIVHTVEVFLTSKISRQDILQAVHVDRVQAELIELPYHSYMGAVKKDSLATPRLDRSSIKIPRKRWQEFHGYMASVLHSLELKSSTTEEDLALIKGIRDFSMKMGQVSVIETLGSWEGKIQKMARELGREIKFHQRFNDFSLDRTLIETISEALSHLLRNSIVHGVESPEERNKAGKKRVGNILLSVQQTDQLVRITLKDDGRGINRDALVAQALRRGVLKPETLSLIDLISLPGISIQEQSDTHAGRGIGFELVRRLIEENLNGRISLESRENQGVVIKIKVPIPKNPVSWLVFRVGTLVYALPQSHVGDYFPWEFSKVEKDENGFLQYPVAGKKTYLYSDIGEKITGTPLERFLIHLRYLDKEGALLCDEILYDKPVDFEKYTLVPTGEDFHFYMQKEDKREEFIYINPAFLQKEPKEDKILNVF